VVRSWNQFSLKGGSIDYGEGLGVYSFHE